MRRGRQRRIPPRFGRAGRPDQFALDVGSYLLELESLHNLSPQPPSPSPQHSRRRARGSFSVYLLAMLSRHARLLRRWPNVALRTHTAELSLGHRALATAAPAKEPSPNDPFANGTNTYYVDEMYRLWRQDPKSVHVSWDVYFTGMDKKGLTSPEAFQPPPSVVPIPDIGLAQ